MKDLHSDSEFKQSRKQNDLGRDPIGLLLLKMGLPAITAQLINVLYNIVDRMFIGQMPGAGSLALTGLGLCFPIITIISAFAMLVGAGGATKAAIFMGEGSLDEAEKILSNAFKLFVVLSILLTVLVHIFKVPLLFFFGASENTLPYAVEYLEIYVTGTIFVLLALGLNPFINAQGFARTGMLSVLIGAVTNIILDPILIFGLNMGVRGAAIATIVSQAISALWVFRFLRGKKTRIRIQFTGYKIDFKLMLPVLALGLSPFIMQVTESMVQITLNSGLQRYGGDLYVGAMTIISSLLMVFMLPLMGLTQGAQPIVAFNYGAKNYNRVRKTFKLLFMLSLGFSIGTCGILMLVPSVFIRMFTSDNTLIGLAIPNLRIFFAAFWMMGAQMACQQTLLGVGAAKLSIFIALFRKVIMLIPLAIIIPVFFGVEGIFIAEPIADFTSVITCVTLCTWKLKHTVPREKLQ